MRPGVRDGREQARSNAAVEIDLQSVIFGGAAREAIRDRSSVRIEAVGRAVENRGVGVEPGHQVIRLVANVGDVHRSSVVELLLDLQVVLRDCTVLIVYWHRDDSCVSEVD